MFFGNCKECERLKKELAIAESKLSTVKALEHKIYRLESSLKDSISPVRARMEIETLRENFERKLEEETEKLREKYKHAEDMMQYLELQKKLKIGGIINGLHERF